MTQSIEEAWADAEQWFMEGQDDLRDAVRAVAVAAFDSAAAAGSVGSALKQIERQRVLRRRIEELGR